MQESGSNIVRQLNQRREHLGISQNRLAEMTGVSLPTVQRFFSDQGANVSIETASNIAQALGMALAPKEIIHEQKLLEEQARKKAHALATMVQGTSALEGQGLSASSYKAIESRLFHELMAGSRRKLWSA